jgi:uncharacterized protein YggE
MRRTALIVLFVCPLAFGQFESNSITVTASNNVTLQPDQAIFSVTVTTGLTTGLDDVLTALQGSGITSANLSGVATQNGYFSSGPITQPFPMLVWSFTLTAPLTNTKTTVASLTTLQQNITKANNGLALSFSIIGTQVSQQLAQSQTCSLSSLLTSATTQAQALATAGGLTLGSILAMSSSTSNVSSSSSYTGVGAIVYANVYSTPPPCAITVSFNVTRY